MSRYVSYINSAKAILELYKAGEPFASFIKKQFAANKKFGSKDRKMIAHICYCFFRLGKSLEQLQLDERMLTALFLCSSSTNEVLQHLNPGWNEKMHLSVDEKLKLIDASLDSKQVFPFVYELSDGVEAEPFCLSHFVQPDLFLRIRPGMKETVLRKLDAATIVYELKGDDCVVLSNTTKIDAVLQLNKEAVVQDYSSQRVGDLMKTVKKNQQGHNNKLQTTNYKLNVWDCCAASGGKSILAADVFEQINLTVSDVRESILVNLKKRFAEAGIKNYRSFVADLSKKSLPVVQENFDLVLADVPCSGSGTWGRTPEQLMYFKPEQINSYTLLQKAILQTVVLSVKKGGCLLYSTCSVYKKENEEIVSFIMQQFQFKLVEQKFMKGYRHKADTMFAALLQRIA